MLPIQGSVVAMFNLANAGVAEKTIKNTHRHIFLSMIVPPQNG
jgi:hypothetical protein